MPDLPARLLSFRETEGLTQREAAALLGVPVNTWARWERGDISPKAGLYRAALEALLDRREL